MTSNYFHVSSSETCQDFHICSAYVLNSWGNKIHPCLTPLPMKNHGVFKVGSIQKYFFYTVLTKVSLLLFVKDPLLVSLATLQKLLCPQCHWNGPFSSDDVTVNPEEGECII